jgi:hypothetical protein
LGGITGSSALATGVEVDGTAAGNGGGGAGYGGGQGGPSGNASDCSSGGGGGGGANYVAARGVGVKYSQAASGNSHNGSLAVTWLKF